MPYGIYSGQLVMSIHLSIRSSVCPFMGCTDVCMDNHDSLPSEDISSMEPIPENIVIEHTVRQPY
jgi:hypothetical protein